MYDASRKIRPREDGSCIHLNQQNECDIYEDRPDICRISPEFHAENARICNEWIRQDEMGDEYLVHLGE